MAKKSRLLPLLLFYALKAFGASGITYHGRLLRPDNTPVSSSSVQFRLQIRTPGAEDCLMYEEIQTLDLSATSGVFSLSLGDGSGTRTDSYSLNWDLFESLSNRQSFTFSAVDCTGPNTYTPNPTDNRRFKVSFNVGSGWETLPIQTINYIPMSIESYAVGGFPASSLFRVEDSGTLGNVSALTTTQYNNLVSLANGSSSVYEKSGELGGSAIPSLTSGQTMVSDGSGGWSAMTPLTSESDPNVSAFAKTSLPTCGAGQVLKSDGTTLTCVTDSGGWTAVDATTTTKGIVSVPTAGGLEVTSGAIGLPDQTLTPGSFTKVTVNQKGIVTAGSQIDGDDITSGTIGGTTAMNTSGDITTTGDLSVSGSVTSGSFSTRQFDLYDSDNTNKISFLAPATGSLTTDYTLTFPATLGSANQLLGMNNAGDALENKSLTAGTGVTITHTAGGIEISATGSGGTVTSVTGTAPISVDNTDAANPVVSLSNSGVGAGTYGSATEVPVFTVDATGRMTGVTDTTISGVSPVGATLSTGKAWLGDGTGKAAEAYINVSDLKKSDGTNQIPLTCTASQTLVYSAVTDLFSCTDIAISNTQVSGLTAGNITNTPSGNISATDVQSAINELDSDLSSVNTDLSSDISEKVAKAGDTMSGDLDMGGNQILNISNVPFVSTDPTVSEDGQTLRWNNTSGAWEWFSPGVAGSGISSFNGETGNTQTLAIGTSGNSPAWTSASDTHTLNIPMASTTGVTAGLIGKTDYDNFNSKLGAVAGSSLTSTNIWVGDSSNQAQAVAMSGDATLSNTGVLTLSNSGVGAGTYGSATEIPIITTDSKGRVTSVTETSITGTSPVGSALAAAQIWVGDGSGNAQPVAVSGDATLASDGTLTLADTAASAGTYKSVTVDSKGRVTTGANPTTLSGYGITDAVTNAGNTPSIQSGTDATKPSAGTTGRLYISTDTQEISRDNGTSWDVIARANGSGGTVTSVTGNSPIQVATGTSTPVISVDDASTTAKGVVTLATDGETTAGEAVQANDSRLSSISGKLDDDLDQYKVFVGDSSGKAAAQWFGVADLRTSTGAQQFADANCTSSQTMTWSSLTDAFSCSDISITKSQISDFPTLGTAATKNFGTSAGNLVELDSGGKIPSSLLPSGSGDFMKDGSVAMTGNLKLGGHWLSNDGGSEGIFVDINGNVGIGTTSPTSKLDVVGQIQSTSNLILGSTQFVAFDSSPADLSGAVFAGINVTGNYSIGTCSGATCLGKTIAFTYDKTNHRVGIGVLSPLNKLDVGAGVAIGTYAGSNIAPSNGLIISGNVGIGTTAPSTLLDVNGTITSRPSGTSTGQTGQLALQELAANGTSTVTLRAPDSLAGNYSLTLPVDDGTSGQILTTDGSGVLSWEDAASGGGGSLTNFMEAVNSTAPNATVPVVSLTANNAATNVDVAFSPKGTGALTAHVADGTTTGGNKRGQHAVDLQLYRANASQVASGNYATVSGGFSNSSSSVGATVSGGLGNKASGWYAAVPGGQSNTASGFYSLAANYFTTADSYAQTTVGQYNLPTGSETTSFWVATDPLFVVGNGANFASKSNALMILKNGNVGIGTTTPGEKLQVEGNIKLSGTGNGITFPDGTTQITAASGGGSGDFMKDGSVAMTGNLKLGGHWLSNDGGSEGIFVDINGNVGVGTQTPAWPFEVASASINGDRGMQIRNTQGGVNARAVYALYNGTEQATIALDSSTGTVPNELEIRNASSGGIVMKTSSGTIKIDQAGNVGIGTTTPAVALDVVGDIQYTGTLTDVSDRRLKENIQPLREALPALRELRTYSYTMKQDKKKRTEFGLIAQEVEQVLPELVSTVDTKQNYKGVNYIGLIPWILKSVQELNEKVNALCPLPAEESESLRRKITSLEQENSRLNTEVKALKERQNEVDRLLSILMKVHEGK